MKFSHIHILFLLLLLVIAGRLTITYLNPTGHLRFPEWSFAYGFVGRDIKEFSVRPAYDILQGKSPRVVDYASVFGAAIAIKSLESAGVCRPNDPAACEQIIFEGIVVFGVAGFLVLLYIFIQKNEDRIVALLTYTIFLLGVPMTKAIEAGNMELVLSVLTGIILLYLRTIKRKGRASVVQSWILGILLAGMINTKPFLILPAAIVLFTGSLHPIAWISFLGSFAITALWPRVYGVHTGLWDVFIFSFHVTNWIGKNLYTQIAYGSNSIIAYVSGALLTLDIHTLSPPVHRTLTYMISALIMGFILVKPWFDENAIKMIRNERRLFSPFSFQLVLWTIFYICIITIPAWSYDYRILYGLPLVFVLWGEARDAKTRHLLYLSIISLCLKCLWVSHERILTVFLYIHLYYLLRASLSLWLVNTPLVLYNGKHHEADRESTQ